MRTTDFAPAAVELAQGHFYGLAAGAHTTDLDRAVRVARRIHSGMVWAISYGLGGDIGAPFGSYRHPGHGRDMGRHGIEKYFRVKSVWVQPEQQA